MILAQDGLLKVSDPVVKYLPDFPFGDKITIHHLLTHTAGLGDYESDPEYLENMNNIRSIQGILPIIYTRKLLFEVPGETMEYSNSGAVVLGAIIEKISGQSYSEFLNEYIFSPLKMHNTCSKYLEDIVENRAVGYIRKFSGGYKNSTFLVSPPSSATGLLTSVNDILLFDQAL
jgi:CubicO group peptidase (beta-lactamase class C family)